MVWAPKINPPFVDLESPLRAVAPKYLFVHTAECAEYDGADDAVSAYLARMGNASIHASIDNNSITPSVPENRVAWAASNRLANNFALQAEWAGRADQGTAGWDDQFSRDQLRVGAWLYAKWATEYNIPVRHGSVQDLRDGRPGIYAHYDSTLAWNNPDGHYDPGPTFPWDPFLAMVREFQRGGPAAPPVQEEEHPMFYIVDGREGRLSAWLLFGFEKKWIKDPNYSALFEQASKQNQVGMKFVGIQGAGSPYIGMLDHAKLVNPEETPKNLGGLA